MNLFNGLTGRIRRMRHISRYSSLPALHPQNVAEHSWEVAFTCMAIGLELGREHRIDMGLLLKRALVHDLSETMSGDIIRSYKHGSQAMHDACENADRNNMVKLLQELDDGFVETVVYDHWTRAKDFELEGRIVAFADMLTVVTYCRDEHRAGNRELDHVLKDVCIIMYREFHSHPQLHKYFNDVFPNGIWKDAYR